MGSSFRIVPRFHEDSQCPGASPDTVNRCLADVYGHAHRRQLGVLCQSLTNRRESNNCKTIRKSRRNPGAIYNLGNRQWADEVEAVGFLRQDIELPDSEQPPSQLVDLPR